VSAFGEHVGLFKADWIADPDLLAQRMRAAGVADRYTTELAGWCGEIHEHLRELTAELGIELLLMGGNGASLRFDAVSQRGSRDNDYLTAATPEDIERLMEHLGRRFAQLGELMQPRPYQPKKPVRDLPLATYVVPVPLLLDHGHSKNNEVKVEFHFEQRLPASESITGTLGPAATPEMTAALPQLPYQIGIKLMTLAAEPVGIDEATRAAAVPRQMYDLDLLLARLGVDRWTALNDYSRERYAEECKRCDAAVNPGEPFDGMRARLERWGDCLDEQAQPWLTIRAAQQSGLRLPAHLRPWGWRARAYRLILAVEALRLGPEGLEPWETAAELAALVPDRKAKAFRAPLADLAGIPVAQLPVQLHYFVWTALDPGRGGDLLSQIARAHELLRSV
jgi:hypothetical protein